MSSFNKLENSKLPKVLKGRAADIPDFFNKVIRPQFLNTEIIKKIHSSLISYMNSNDSAFFVRLYGSYSRNNYHLQRRGFLTKYKDNVRVTFCDNTFTLLFAGMKLAGIPYTHTDLKELFNQKKLVVGFAQVSREKELCYYTPIGAKRANLNAKGWYQAHIKPTGYGYNDLDLKTSFPNPPRNEYNIESKIRQVDRKLTNEQLHILKAHFLRLIHPFNSFLVPKKNHLDYSGINIGEENELINYVRQYIRKTFPSEYRDFDKLSIEYDIDKPNTTITNIKWFDKPKNTKQTLSKKSFNKDKKIGITEKESIDYESELDINLEKSLRAIGKEVFAVILYQELSKNIDVKYNEISEKHEKYNSFTIHSQRSRLSKAKAIFRAGEETEALLNIYNSNKIKTEVKSEIFKYINRL